MSGFDIKRAQHKTGRNDAGGTPIKMIALYVASASVWCGYLSVFKIAVESLVVYAVLGVPVLLWGLAFGRKKGVAKRALPAAFFTAAAAFGLRDLLLDGIKHMANAYISLHNEFYTASQPLFEEGSGMAGRLLAVLFLQILTTAVLAFVLYRRRCVFIAILVMVLPFLLAATVGYMPSSVGVWFSIGASIFYVLVYAQTDNGLLKKELLAAGCVYAALVLFGTLVQPMILKVREDNDQLYVRVHDKLVDAQQVDLGNLFVEIFRGNANYSVGGIGKGDLRSLAENRPQGTKDLELVLSEAPTARIYLKAYVGAEYTGRKWKEPSVNEFRQMLKRAGASGEERTLFGEPFRRIKEGAEGIKSSKMKIRITGASVEFAYSPYFSEVTEEDDVYGDAYIRGQGKSEREYTFYQQSEIQFLYTGALGGGTEVWQSYGDYVDTAYTEKVEGLEKLEEYCRDIDTDTLDTVALSIDRKFSHGLQYTREPGVYPSSEDFAEYFLTESRKGFCVHFATAAALIYRECGYPSRYVEGYAVPPSAFKRQEDGTYKATVTDGMAHAWCETFEANIGWQVKEHTLPFRADQNWEAEPNEITEQESGEPEDAQLDNIDPRPDEPEEPQNDPARQEQKQEEAEGPSGEGGEDRLVTLGGEGKPEEEGAGKKLKRILVKVAAGGVILLGTIAILALICIAQQKIRMQKKKYQFRQKAHNRGIQVIFRAIYDITVFAGLKDNELNDRDALRQMQMQFPELSDEEWSWLYDCAMRAAFGEGQLEKREQQKMYELYKKFRKEILSQLTAKQRFVFVFVRGI